MNTRKFLERMDEYNARVYAAEQQLRALEAEREILRAQAGDFMRLSQFDSEIATFTASRFSYPEGYQAPQGEKPAADKAPHQLDR